MARDGSVMRNKEERQSKEATFGGCSSVTHDAVGLGTGRVRGREVGGGGRGEVGICRVEGFPGLTC